MQPILLHRGHTFAFHTTCMSLVKTSSSSSPPKNLPFMWHHVSVPARQRPWEVVTECGTYHHIVHISCCNTTVDDNRKWFVNVLCLFCEIFYYQSTAPDLHIAKLLMKLCHEKELACHSRKSIEDTACAPRYFCTLSRLYQWVHPWNPFLAGDQSCGRTMNY